MFLYSSSDVLALPIFKQEESNLPADNENKILPFQYVLCAATSPAIKLHDETLTYLNQGQQRRTHNLRLHPTDTTLNPLLCWIQLTFVRTIWSDDDMAVCWLLVAGQSYEMIWSDDDMAVCW